MTDTIDAILMASGSSVRFSGGNKLLALFRGKPLVRHTLDLLSTIDCFRRIFFIAADPALISLAQNLRTQIDPRLEIIRNEMAFLDQRESIRLGTEHSDADYLMFFPCDMPLLDESTVRSLVNARQTGKICRPEHDKEAGSPVLFSSVFREELLTLGHTERGSTIIRRHPDKLIRVEIASRLPLTDIDTVEALRSML
ncbi:MAG: nucleotidyltransferase family protein [Spirochaetaceae bacterium]|nr:nucleotidyltransferase family protein [Spirochaetaceae bacterium]